MNVSLRMKILAVEFSSQRRSVSVAQTSPEFRVLATVTEDNRRGSNGMVLIDRGLQEARLTPAEIDLIAVGLGPGSYAGIRSAIAISQGWQLARGTRLLGIGSIEVLAHDAQQAGHFGQITIMIDAQRSEFYAARYDITEKKIESLEAVRISPLAVLGECANLFGPGASRLVPGATDLYPGAVTLARLATVRSDFRAGEDLEPIYLREVSFVKTQGAKV
jgi:tRNA threonylcarbamoyl adenosine modification protein YeaZ